MVRYIPKKDRDAGQEAWTKKAGRTIIGLANEKIGQQSLPIQNKIVEPAVKDPKPGAQLQRDKRPIEQFLETTLPSINQVDLPKSNQAIENKLEPIKTEVPQEIPKVDEPLQPQLVLNEPIISSPELKPLTEVPVAENLKIEPPPSKKPLRTIRIPKPVLPNGPILYFVLISVAILVCAVLFVLVSPGNYKAQVELNLSDIEKPSDQIENVLRESVHNETVLTEIIKKVEKLPKDEVKKREAINKFVYIYRKMIIVKDLGQSNFIVAVAIDDPQKAAIILNRITWFFLIENNAQFKARYFNSKVTEFTNQIDQKIKTMKEAQSKKALAEIQKMARNGGWPEQTLASISTKNASSYKNELAGVSAQLKDLDKFLSEESSGRFFPLFFQPELLALQRTLAAEQVDAIVLQDEVSNPDDTRHTDKIQKINAFKSELLNKTKELVKKPLKIEDEESLALLARKMALESRYLALNFFVEEKFRKIQEVDFDGLDLVQDQAKFEGVYADYLKLLEKKKMAVKQILPKDDESFMTNPLMDVSRELLWINIVSWLGILFISLLLGNVLLSKIK